ncbi:dihydrofolate reductase [Brevibacillus sp. SYP-B805]|uniref:dihydrofolate reductase n=1 Tax=Brevibacillus sp. SYP-B805 TaxID=1578199 RepID=UPI0013EE16D2|nr:dihydrofolate reductase [Brevibacillus sp. SYP-B805]NGQ94663.1 dihydrofolate reductase [Brevibacillus sp. SYP-B805]
MISLIVAMDQNRLIGRNNGLPWRLPADLQYFKRVTSGKTVIMGRKTYESIGRPLPNRRNIILTTRKDFRPAGCTTYDSVDELMARLPQEEEAFVIGGAEIYRLFLPFADRMYITLIDHAFTGDAYFPSYDESEWRLISSEPGTQNEENPYPYRFTVWERVKQAGQS